MAKIKCSYSGLVLKIPHVSMSLDVGYTSHPIFLLPQKKLLGLYTTYSKGQMTETDSYLLFLALLNSTDAVKWSTPATYSHLMPKLIANNISQLVSVIWETNAIRIPSFRQPSFIIRDDSSDLRTIHNWIKAWRDNIWAFKTNYKHELAAERLQLVENKLSYILRSGIKDSRYPASVATWANLAASFPPTSRDNWQAIIRKCFNDNAMFGTPKKELLAIKAYCEENIEAGSIHFHALMQVLGEGIKRHQDFLGLWLDESPASLASGVLSEEQKIAREKEASKLAEIIASAPDKEPSRLDYATNLAFIRAKLAYRSAQNAIIVDTGDTANV